MPITTRRLALLALALLAPATLAAAAPAKAPVHHFRTRTSQHRLLSLSVSGHHISALRFSVTLDCSDGSTLTDTERGFEAIRIGAHGRFSDSQAGAADIVTLRGVVGVRRVTGTVRVTDRPVKGVTCDSRTVRFSALAR